MSASSDLSCFYTHLLLPLLMLLALQFQEGEEVNRKMWPFSRKGPSGFSSSSTAEEVTEGIDGTGLVAIITGASSGIGSETARVLALRGVHVVMGVRKISSGNQVREAILKEKPTAKVDVLELDLSSMASVKKFSSEFHSMNLPLNILINNAGVMGTPFTLSEDGIEMQFATNYIGHFLLTHLLVEKMKDTARSCDTEGRIINVASELHRRTYKEGIRFDEINSESGYQTYLAYGQSKLATILHANELSRRFMQEGVLLTANSVHPGVIVTNILRYENRLIAFIAKMLKMIMKSIPQGAATSCYVALHPQVKGVTGKYFSDSNVGSPSSKSSNMELAKRLWDFSMETVSPWL